MPVFGSGPGKSDADKEAEERKHAEAALSRHDREEAEVRKWRRRKLTAAGFSEAAADLILSWDITPSCGLAGEALRLVKDKGCPPSIALDLVRPDVLPASAEGAPPEIEEAV